MDRYAVIGHPVGHSKSPRIHAAFAAQVGHRLSYSALGAPRAGFREACMRFIGQGGRGLNVTVPFKLEALELADVLDPLAAQAQAVNTIVVTGSGALEGHNTDGIGLVRDLTTNLGCVLRGARVLVVGAGGAVRGIVAPLLAEGVAELRVLNRTRATAQALVAAFDVPELALHAPGDGAYDVVLNATSAGLSGAGVDIPADTVHARTFAYDLSYGAAARPFMAWAHAAGAKGVRDGLGMLVEQAAESFRLWRGVMPDTAPVIRMLDMERTS
jgi:shikimate dehydrogenase